MTSEPYGHFLFRRQHVPDGQRYVYSLDRGPDRADPASRWQPNGVGQPSAVVRSSHFEWSDANWRGVERENLVFYEIHVGTFTAEGNFDGVISRLPAFRELGVTALELMPVAQIARYAQLGVRRRVSIRSSAELRRTGRPATVGERLSHGRHGLLFGRRLQPPWP